MIINADDFGYSESVNLAVAECFRRKFVNRATIMVNMPYAQDAAEIARKNNFFDAVGLHINLTEGKALTEKCARSSLCDENGYFKGEFHIPIKSRLWLKREVRDAIRAETEAQIKKYIDMGFRRMHADSHNYTHTYLSVYRCIRGLLKKYRFKSVRISRNIPENDFSLPFKIYKVVFNAILTHTKCDGHSIAASKYFGSVQDFEKLPKKERYRSDMEFMTHPDYIDGVLTDNTLPVPRPFV